jgi:hypothetical protein
MLSEETLSGMLGWLAAIVYNPNNVTDEAAPVAVRLEREAGCMVVERLGCRVDCAWARMTSCGTVANLEMLWVARVVQFILFGTPGALPAQNITQRLRSS